MNIPSRLEALRRAMHSQKIDAYILPSADPHQSEYLPDFWKVREWISGFTGSAGTAVVTSNHAGIWTDARYFLQAEQELNKTGFVLHKLKVQGNAEYVEWLASSLPEGSTVGIDGVLFSLAQVKGMQKLFAGKNIQLKTDSDLISGIWTDRPSLPLTPIFEHATKFTGRTVVQKLALVREKMKAMGAQKLLITTLDDIGWTLNIRCNDVESNPVAIAYLVVEEGSAILFINPAKVSPIIARKLEKDKVSLQPYGNVYTYLSSLSVKQALLIDADTINYRIYGSIASSNIIQGANIPLQLKAIKNETEMKHIRNVMVKDGVALVKAFRWLEAKVANGGTTDEVTIAEKIAECRAQQIDYFGESFNAIIGYKGNGAIIHYHAAKATCATVKREGILLLDSGGQYHDGTTDITRTISLDGKPTDEECRNYTLVLKGHIALANLVFPAGTRGVQMDVLARMFLWKQGLNFLHGVGHGVGFFMNVHEPPQGFIAGLGVRGTTVMQVGMLTSNEPGFYKTNEYGIRIENLVLCVEHDKTEYGEFLKFETVTLFPIDTTLVKKALLTKEEKDWLNNYHKVVYRKLSPKLNADEKAWLKEKCKKV
ncbi:MAG: aminopeptidase P family protein [Saprospiraceae bacterium]|nr:aminopeptidase P family protein [Saprospiraceae bacterium]MBP7680101.1 aminopeptidase P family protein [Saprospiraceae bacterium]